MLLTIDTDLCSVTIEGPDRSSRWRSSNPGSTPTLGVRVEGGMIRSLTWPGAAESAAGHREYRGEGPALAEETSYQLTVASNQGQRLQLRHRDPVLIANVRPVRGHEDVQAGTINFRSQVGRSTFVVTDGARSVELEVEVRPTKLDYDLDYQDLLDGVSGLSRQLVLEYLRATYLGGRAEVARTSHPLEWLLLLREEVEHLERALDQVAAQPHVQLVRERQMRAPERIKRPSSSVRRALVRSQGEGPWVRSALGSRHRSRLPAEVPQETLDTPEHRWLAAQLRGAVTSLAELRRHVLSRSDAGTISKRASAIDVELRGMEERLSPFLQRSPLAEALNMTEGAFSSLALLGRPGYREAYQSLMRLRMSTHVGGEALQLPIRDLADLYEIWCFVAVVALVAEVLGVTVDARQLVKIEDNGIHLRLLPGKASEVSLNHSGGTVRVAYNRQYRSLTGSQRPDIVVQVERPGEAPMVLLCDAKYRLETSPEYIRAFGGVGPPVDAVGQLHRYRDAVVVRAAGFGRGRPTVRGVALFPLGEDDSSTWTDHSFCDSIDDLGIGALPFLPSNMDWVREWLEQSLKAPSERLAWPGPPFLAWERRTRS